MGGGGVSIPQRNMGQELGQLYGTGLPLQLKNYKKWWQGEDLLSGAHDFALKNLNDVGELTDPLKNTFSDLEDLYKGLPDVSNLTNPLEKMLASLGGVYDKQLAPVLNRGGALTEEQNRDVTQATRAAFADRGNVMGNQAVGAELLNRDAYRRDRFNEALSQGLGISGEERGLTGSIEGLLSGDVATRLGIAGGEAGIAGGIQGLQTGALNNALDTEKTQVGTFATPVNPLLSYASNLNESNQNAAGAESIAGGNKSSSLIGGAGQIIGAVLPLLAASDRRVKEDITDTGRRTKKGTKIKRWRYKGNPRVFEGPIAQELEIREPERVLTEPWSGLKRVVGRVIEVPTLMPRSLLPPIPA